MCCFDNERFTLFCCVHTYQQWDLLDLPPFLRNVLRYVRTRRISVKPIYMRSCNGFHSHESPNPPSGRVGDVVAMLQIEFSGIGNHGVAEAAGFQRCKGVFLAPHPVDFIEILGADGRIRFALDISSDSMKSKILLLSRLTASRFSRMRSLSVNLKLLATSRCKPSNAHRKIPSASAFIFSARSGSSALSTCFSLVVSTSCLR